MLPAVDVGKVLKSQVSERNRRMVMGTLAEKRASPDVSPSFSGYLQDPTRSKVWVRLHTKLSNPKDSFLFPYKTVPVDIFLTFNCAATTYSPPFGSLQMADVEVKRSSCVGQKRGQSQCSVTVRFEVPKRPRETRDFPTGISDLDHFRD